MIYNKRELVIVAQESALSFSVPPEFLCSIIEVVSEWNPGKIESMVYEMQIYNPALAAPIVEQRVGLCQLSTKQTAEFGHKEKTEELLDPKLNCKIACEMLKTFLAQVNNQADRAILLMYGYPIMPLIPKIAGKVAAYKKFLAEKPD